MPSGHSYDPILRIAQQVADCFSENGYAFVEDDKLEALATALTSFLKDAGIPVNIVASALPKVARKSVVSVPSIRSTSASSH